MKHHATRAAALLAALTLCAASALAQQDAAAPCPSGWQGEYEWFESEEHPSGEMRMVWSYEIRIGEEQSHCQAWLTGDGHSMMMRILADVQGDARAIRLLYREALPDAGPGSFHERGAELLRLERRERELLTHWGTMTPNAEDAKPGVRFRQKQSAEKKTGSAKKPAAQDAGAFSAADLKRMSTFVSNFTEVGFPDFDMTGSGSAPPSPALIYFGIRHNYTNNFKRRVEHCAEKGCEHGSLVMDAKFVAESVRKYFDLELKHRSVSDAVGWFSSHFDGKRYYFEGADGELLSFARVTRAVREGDIIRMTGDIYLEDEPNNAVGSFVATAKPHKWNGKKTWAILSLKTKRR